MTNGSVSAHLDCLPNFKSFSETEQFVQGHKHSKHKYGQHTRNVCVNACLNVCLNVCVNVCLMCVLMSV